MVTVLIFRRIFWDRQKLLTYVVYIFSGFPNKHRFLQNHATSIAAIAIAALAFASVFEMGVGRKFSPARHS